MELLYEVEKFNRRKLKLRRAVTHPQPDRDREEEFMSRLARIFPEVPLRILERVPGKGNKKTGRKSGNDYLEPFLRAKHKNLDIPWTKRTPDFECGSAQRNRSVGKQLLRISRSTGPL